MFTLQKQLPRVASAAGQSFWEKVDHPQLPTPYYQPVTIRHKKVACNGWAPQPPCFPLTLLCLGAVAFCWVPHADRKRRAASSLLFVIRIITSGLFCLLLLNITKSKLCLIPLKKKKIKLNLKKSQMSHNMSLYLLVGLIRDKTWCKTTPF